ncbi:hypothetical protein P692DRAFT_20867349 [Suillus brevipes Sb2]|nr:hypothetical protein P692DRAFT_20867349 [Suillus brevipes Sb2]
MDYTTHDRQAYFTSQDFEHCLTYNEAQFNLDNDPAPSQRPGACLYTAYQIETAFDSDPESYPSPRSSLPSPCVFLNSNEKQHLIEKGTCDAYLQLYQYGELNTRLSESKSWELQCPDKGCWVKTGIRNHINLTSRGQFMPLEKHFRSCVCISQKSLQKQAVRDSRAALITVVLPPDHSRNNSTDTASSRLTVVASTSRCIGLPMTDWPTLPGVPPEANFPWLHTRDGLDKLPFNVNLVDGVLYACSPNCTRATDDHSPCIPCQQLQSRVHSLANLAGERKNHTRHNVLTPIQLLNVINERNINLNTVKLQSLNDARKIKRMLSVIEDHSSLVMALAQCDVPWLRNLLQTALHNNASIRTILRLIEDALERGYRPRTHGKEADDLALLILRLGGHNLLYALSQRLSLPSLRTLGRHTSFVKIAPIIGQITTGVIQHNIAAVVLAPRAQAGLNTLRGVSFLIDETALEEAAGYLPQSNSIGGLCWTHSHLVDTTLNNYQSALGVADALKSGKVHLGKELTVAGAHVFGEDGIYPILAAPTCKSENFTDMEFVFESVIDSWYASGADRAVGPAWSFATDGDATRRKAGHRTFLCNNINFTSPLFGTLINLPGLNLLTGKHEMTLDFDYKHVFKRFCTLIRSRAGMRLNNGRCINSSMLERYLTWLLYPDDPQDVPRAVALMNAVISLGNIDPTLPPYTLDGTEPDVDVIADFDAIKILSHILHSLLQPFINITLSLTEQVTFLCRCAHLIYACYRNQRRAFMPNQLYYDVQTLIKNIIFCIAKQQKLDATQPFISKISKSLFALK